MITIVDYGMGNLGSIKNMLKRIGHPSIITFDKDEISKASKIILPGVGAFDKAMENLQRLDMVDFLKDKAKKDKIPFLGICLGMQLLADFSEEGNGVSGLGLIPGQVKKFNLSSSYKVPHMGWNTIDQVNDSILFGEEIEEFRYYFVHSYFYKCQSPEHVVCNSTYEKSFNSVIQNGNVYGTQFHPEKSHKFGMNLLKNFAEKS